MLRGGSHGVGSDRGSCTGELDSGSSTEELSSGNSTGPDREMREGELRTAGNSTQVRRGRQSKPPEKGRSRTGGKNRQAGQGLLSNEQARDRGKQDGGDGAEIKSRFNLSRPFNLTAGIVSSHQL